MLVKVTIIFSLKKVNPTFFIRILINQERFKPI